MSRAICCLGIAVGRHSENCIWYGSEVPTPPEQIARALAEPEAEEGAAYAQGEIETWKAERARNLREQRRYEIARDIFVLHADRYFMSIDNAAGAKQSIALADALLDELAKQPEPTQ